MKSETDWVQATSTVTASTYHYARLRDVNLRSYMDQSFFIIEFSYTVDGRTYRDQFEQFEALEAGYEIQMLYDPAEPRRNTLAKQKLGARATIIAWIAGIAFAGLIIYLERHFNIPSRLELGR